MNIDNSILWWVDDEDLYDVSHHIKVDGKWVKVSTSGSKIFINGKETLWLKAIPYLIKLWGDGKE